jgi:hypothetical protein
MIEALRRLPGFERLSDAALELIVARSAQRRFAPGQVVLAGGSIAEVLFGCVGGEVVDPHGTRSAAVFDAPGLLFGLAARGDYRAGPDGLSAILIAKPHVFTIVREFPEFVVSLLSHAPGRPAEAAR